AALDPLRQDLRGREAEVRLRKDRDAGAAGALPHGAQRRAAGRADARSAEPRARQGHADDRAEGLRGRGAAVQPRLAEADTGDPVRQAEAAGEEEDAVRAAVDRRRRAGRIGTGSSAAETYSGI